MDLTPEPRFLEGFTPISGMPQQTDHIRERAAERPERRLMSWLYQSVPGFIGGLVLCWGFLLNNVNDHAHPMRMLAWSVLLLLAALTVGLLWRSMRAGRPLGTLAEWGDAHRSSLWVLGFAWGAAAFLVIPHMTPQAPAFAWFLVPLGGLLLAVPCATDLRSATAIGLPPLAMTLLSLLAKGTAMLPLALAIAGAGALSAVLIWSVHRLVRDRAETAVRLGPEPARYTGI